MIPVVLYSVAIVALGLTVTWVLIEPPLWVTKRRADYTKALEAEGLTMPAPAPLWAALLGQSKLRILKGWRTALHDAITQEIWGPLIGMYR